LNINSERDGLATVQRRHLHLIKYRYVHTEVLTLQLAHSTFQTEESFILTQLVQYMAARLN